MRCSPKPPPLDRTIRCAVASLVGLMLAVPNVQAASEPTAVEAPGTGSQEEHDPRLDEARRLHDQGQAAYETYDYPSAITAWTKAYASIEGHPRADQIRHAVVYNLAAARMAQYRVDGDETQLGLAKRLLVKYSEALDRDAQAERAQVQGKIAEIDALLDTKEETPSPSPPAPVVEPPMQDEPPPRPRKAGTGLIVGGAIALAGGLGATVGMAVGLARGRAADEALADPMRPAADLEGLRDDGRQANAIAIVCGVTGALLVGAGVTMLVVGARRHARGNNAAWRREGGLVWRF
jgi:hypothetical protein